MIEYSWRSYESEQAQLIFYKFLFKNKAGRVVGSVQNMSDDDFKSQVVTNRMKFIRKDKQYAFVNDNEVICGMQVGLRKTQSLVHISFIIQKI